MIVKSFFFIVVLFVVGVLAQMSASESGFMTLYLQGYAFTMSSTAFVWAAAALLILAFIGGRIWEFLKEVPFALERKRKQKKVYQGMDTVLKGLEAVEAGEFSQAAKLAKKAQKLLPAHGLTTVLQAEAAALTGKESEAQQQYLLLSNQKSGNFIGLKGLLDQALSEKDWAKVYALTTQAYKQKPKNAWLMEILFEAQMRSGHFDEALKFLPVIRRKGDHVLEKLDFYEASMNLQKAEAVEAESSKKALKYVEAGLKVCPQHFPLFQKKLTFLKNSKTKDATEKALFDFWRATYSIKIVDMWYDTVKDQPAKKILKKAERFAQETQDRPEGLYAQAKVFLAQEMWKEAREVLTKAISRESTKEVFLLMGELDDTVAPKTKADYEWLQKALNANPAAWQADILEEDYDAWCKEYISSEDEDAVKPTALAG